MLDIIYILKYYSLEHTIGYNLLYLQNNPFFHKNWLNPTGINKEFLKNQKSFYKYLLGYLNA